MLLDPVVLSTACRLLVCNPIRAGRLDILGYLRLGTPSLTQKQDLKDFARNSGQLDVVYSETGRERNGKGYVLRSRLPTSSNTTSGLSSLKLQRT